MVGLHITVGDAVVQAAVTAQFADVESEAYGGVSDVDVHLAGGSKSGCLPLESYLLCRIFT